MEFASRPLWVSSGIRLLNTTKDNRLAVSDDFLRAFWLRPEVAPVEESCNAERDLHARFMESPRYQASPAEIDAIADPDARDGYRIVIGFRDHLLQHDCIEAAYMALFSGERIQFPPLFMDQLVHVVMAHLLRGATDPFLPRAGEIFFRTQRVSITDAGILLADEDTVEMTADTGGFGNLGQLLIENQTAPRTVELDVLTEDNAEIYWERTDAFDTVLDLNFTRQGLDALCRVLERWVGHMLGIEARIQPLSGVTDERWRWHVGLDATATGILNDLYRHQEIDEARMRQLLSLFRLDILDRTVTQPEMIGRPIYLGIAMDGKARLHMKPQNLLFNLPLLTTG